MNKTWSDNSIYRALFEHAADAIMALKDDVFVECNAKALELFGCTREQFIGKTPYHFAPDRQPDERNSRDKAMDLIAATLEHGPQRFEWQHKRCDGSLFDAEVALTRVDTTEGALLVAVIRDITERKRLQDAVHNIAAGISAATGQGYLNLLVRYVARALGASCAFVGELVGGERVQTVALVRDDALADNIEYDLAGSPCQNVVGARLCIYARDVQHSFPEDQILEDLQAESYIGVPLFDSNHQSLGLLAAIKRTPIENPDFAEYIMRIFAARTAGELERKRSLQKLLEEKRLTETIVNSLPGIFYMIDAQGRAVWRNKTLREALRPEAGEHDITDSLEPVIDEDREAAMASIREVFETGTSSVEVRGRHTDGSVHTYYCTGARVEIGGSPYLVGAGIDISDLKRMEDALRASEVKFRTIFENAPIALFQSTPEGRLLEVNQAAAAMFGYDSPEQMATEVSDIAPQLFVHPEQRAQFVDRVLTSGEFLHTENEYRRRDGSIIVTNLYMGVQRREGDQTFLMGFVEDITDRLHAERDKRMFYRETILSVTNGKLVICDRADMEPYLSNALMSATVREPGDLVDVRDKVREFCIENGLSPDRTQILIAGVGEAATNAVKHADGGKVHAGVIDGAVWAGVSDKGAGIEHIILPRAVLLRGFSTKPSLGFGYTIMLDVADHVLLATDETGTTVILVKDLQEKPDGFRLDQLINGWSEAPTETIK